MDIINTAVKVETSRCPAGNSQSWSAANKVFNSNPIVYCVLGYRTLD